MKFVDDSQNLRVRLRVIQAAVVLLLGVLGVRLYMLQIVNGARYAEVAENQRIRLLPILAPRGVIMDRNGTVLVDSRPIYSVILSREVTKKIDYNLIKPLADGLQIDGEILKEHFDQAAASPAFESILIKEGVTTADIPGSMRISSSIRPYASSRRRNGAIPRMACCVMCSATSAK